ncbi:MAG: recombination regulator RecX [Betaproteobacteria bacterium]
MPELRARALRLLARREHSRAELLKKLATHAESEDELQILLDTLQGQRLLSDERYASQRVAARSSRFGNQRLRQELRGVGVGDLETEQALAGSGDEAERCRGVWQKKFGVPAESPEERAKQMRFLQNRGFSSDAIRRVLRGSEE